MNAKWIWYPGDFEIYHSMLLHTRRTEYDFDYPPSWHVSRPELSCTFSREVSLEKETEIFIHAHGKGYIHVNGRKMDGVNKTVMLPKGNYNLSIEVFNRETFPSVFIDSDCLKTDESWDCHFRGISRKKAACEPAFTKEGDDPSVFPFSYKKLEPISCEEIQGGVLYDFGVESFGPVTVYQRAENGAVSVYYGESREEALDTEMTMVRVHLAAKDGETECMARAFRYIFVKAQKGIARITAKLEYLPIRDIASFSCDDVRMENIWEICSRAFHLNSREFYLDGIKRDRWVWAGDAYQSFMVNRYLYAEPSIIRRTIRALLDKQPYIEHINKINDYSAYMFLAVWDYYYATGDLFFVSSVWDNLNSLYQFIVSRLDEETGYVIERPGDWIFIDWANIDKNGPVCAEQILLYMVYRAMARLSKALGESTSEYEKRADVLKERVMRDFWDEEHHAFIDTYASGKNHISRHANIFAILTDFVNEKTRKDILKNVLLSNLYEEITTPYFKLFELMALSKMGEIETVQNYIDSYWGGMLDNGATSTWEEYDPKKHGVEHYQMYGDRYGCSLCHAWGAGPILLLGKYIAGVQPTSIGSETFEVVPKPGRYRRFHAVVPVEKGSVVVDYQNEQVTVSTDVQGGTLIFHGKQVEIPVGQAVTIS